MDNKQMGIPHTFPETSNLRQIDHKQSRIRFTFHEVDNAIAALKPNKALGLYQIISEFITHLGHTAKTFLTSAYNRISDRKIQKISLMSKIIEIPKPNKDSTSPSSVRQITLLSILFQLFENHSRKADSVGRPPHNPKTRWISQKPFNNIKNSITNNHIENGFKPKQKTCCVFINLSQAYDTVSHNGLMLKFRFIIPPIFVEIIYPMIRTQKILGTQICKTNNSRKLKSSILQRSVLDPILSNIYLNDIPLTSI
ncbi:putative RNA-directed DNA polymerase from transposon BS [Thelohanellus kitauei]|uniref:Putative RNA-directed DNA polymerase from transposon BS n=1 Tax=Thelohanellus kitauei TaxID=669202 RepID=A0A0C2MKR4_THEKT|nr:putative RNA-directed DNA polymerase from transposon BS [Thelohanellus kitauei]